MLERVIVVVASVVGAALAAGVLSSRRTRGRNRVRADNELAGDLEPHDPASAASVRQHVTAAVEQLMAMERAALTRRFDPGSVVAALLLIAPVGVASAPWTCSAVLRTSTQMSLMRESTACMVSMRALVVAMVLTTRSVLHQQDMRHGQLLPALMVAIALVVRQAAGSRDRERLVATLTDRPFAVNVPVGRQVMLPVLS